MKLTLIFFFLAVSQMMAIDTYSQSTRLSLNLKAAAVKDVLDEIEENSEFVFLYNYKLVDVDRKVTIDIREQKITEILKTLFQGTDIVYTIVDRQIVLTNKADQNSFMQLATQQAGKVIKGKVTDAHGGPIPGVSVVLKGTTSGTITDMEGNFSLNEIPPGAILQFSFVGMKSQEIVVENETTVTVVLEEETIGIEEVVAIGYGTVKKSDLTGAVGSVSGEAVTSRKTTQLSQALQGVASGVMVTRDNNAPGSTATIHIRGITTIGDSNPLIIVDGVPVNDINDVNSNDVESISILKDAASASIYGSRAAAGVILITTKRAQSNQLNMEYNFEYGLEKPTERPEYANVTRYMRMVNELRWNDLGNGPDEYPTYPKDLINNYNALYQENPDLYPNTDWNSLIFKDHATRQSHVFGLTAGSKNIRTKVSLSYDKTGALYDHRTFERITARFNNDVTINKYLSAKVDFYAKRSISKQPAISSGTIIDQGRMAAPIYAAKWSDGRVAYGKAGENIYGQLHYGGFNNDWYNQIGGKLSIDLTPLEGLKISGIISPNLNFDQNKTFTKQVPTYDWEDPTVREGYLIGFSSNALNEARNNNHQVTTQFLTNYEKAIGLSHLNILAGYENYYAFYETMGASSNQLALSSYPYLDLKNSNFIDASGSAYENAYRSYFGRIMYNFDNKYYLQGNIRYDASSRFDKNYRWGSFPSFSAGWVVTEEPFMKDVANLSFLKIRASWGILGNERIGNYPYQSSLAFSNALIYLDSDIVSALTAAQTAYAIRDITWEQTESYDLGFDAGLFHNKLRLTWDYYRKTTKDMLLPLEIPDYIGLGNPDQNAGKMKTNGWEADLTWNDQFGDVRFSASFNISDFKSVMGDLGGTEFIGDQIKIKGSEFNEWYGYKSAGLFQTDEEVNTLPRLNPSVRPGDIRYQDISGPDGVPDGNISPEYDRVLLGGSLPRYMYGINLNMNYKNFDFSMFLQGVGKQNSRLTIPMVQPYYGQWRNMPMLLEGKYWSKYNSEAQNLNAEYPRFSTVSLNNNYTMSDYWLIKGGYFRLKNITLGYTIPDQFMQSLGIQSCRIFSSISDLFSMNHYPKGWDPESSATGYPITSSFIFGVSLKF